MIILKLALAVSMPHGEVWGISFETIILGVIGIVVWVGWALLDAMMDTTFDKRPTEDTENDEMADEDESR